MERASASKAEAIWRPRVPVLTTRADHCTSVGRPGRRCLRQKPSTCRYNSAVRKRDKSLKAAAAIRVPRASADPGPSGATLSIGCRQRLFANGSMSPNDPFCDVPPSFQPIAHPLAGSLCEPSFGDGAGPGGAFRVSRVLQRSGWHDPCLRAHWKPRRRTVLRKAVVLPRWGPPRGARSPISVNTEFLKDLADRTTPPDSAFLGPAL